MTDIGNDEHGFSPEKYFKQLLVYCTHQNNLGHVEQINQIIVRGKINKYFITVFKRIT